MARDLKVTYGTYVIGGATGPDPVERLSQRVAYPGSELTVDFLVTGDTDAALAAACAAAETSLRIPRQRLKVELGAATLLDYDPALANNSGFDAEPEVLNLGEAPNSGRARRYRLTVRFQRPADLTGQAGRREEDQGLVSQLQNRRVVTLAGTYTAVPGADARAQYLAQIDAHATAVLTAVAAGGTFVLAEEDARTNDSGKLLSYRRVYWEHVDGRRDSLTDVAFSPNRVRVVTISGTYVRTAGGAASVNYATAEPAHSAAVLTALTGTYELVDEATKPNEKDDTYDFRRVYRELVHQQASGVTDDPQVFRDAIRLAVRTTAPGDAPFALSGPTGTSSAGLQSRRLVEATVLYEAWLLQGVAPRAKWTGSLRAHLLALVASRLAFTGTAVTDETVDDDPVENKLTAQLRITGASGDLLEYTERTTVVDRPGRLLTLALGGRDHEYLDQRGPAVRTRVRTARALVRRGGAVKLASIFAEPGERWVLVQRDQSEQPTRLGAGPVVDLVVLEVREEWTYVESRVGVTRTVSR